MGSSPGQNCRAAAWLMIATRWAPGTSLAAIILIGSLAAITQAFYGNVDLWLGLAIGVPGAIGVVAVHLRDAEHGHGGVADELLDAASVLLERSAREVEERLEGPADVLRIAPVDQLGRTDDVREHDRRELPLPAPAGVDGSAARGAEPRFV